MDLKQLKYFVEVAKHGSFTQASKILYITPQALSKSINQLEKEYNCQLFIRKDNNTLALSHIGQQILCKVKNLLEQYFLIDQHIKQLSDMEGRYFKVAIAQNALNIIDIDLFNSFKETYPELCHEYIELPDKLVDEYIESDRVDVCFNINELPNNNEYRSILVCSSELCAIERSRNLIIDRDYMVLRDLADKKIVAKAELYKSYDIIKEAAKKERIEFKHILKTSDETLMIDRISSKEYVGIGVYAVENNLEYNDILAVPFMPSLPWNIYLSYKKYKAHSKSVQMFIRFVKEKYCE